MSQEVSDLEGLLEGHIHSLEDNIKINLTETVCKGMDFVYLTYYIR